jgi:hypothetical protein
VVCEPLVDVVDGVPGVVDRFGKAVGGAAGDPGHDGCNGDVCALCDYGPVHSGSAVDGGGAGSEVQVGEAPERGQRPGSPSDAAVRVVLDFRQVEKRLWKLLRAGVAEAARGLGGSDDVVGIIGPVDGWPRLRPGRDGTSRWCRTAQQRCARAGRRAPGGTRAGMGVLMAAVPGGARGAVGTMP